MLVMDIHIDLLIMLFTGSIAC